MSSPLEDSFMLSTLIRLPLLGGSTLLLHIMSKLYIEDLVIVQKYNIFSGIGLYRGVIFQNCRLLPNLSLNLTVSIHTS